MEPRVATPEDLDGIVETLTFAFSGDPLWNWAFPDGEAQRAWWTLFAGSALRRYQGDHDVARPAAFGGLKQQSAVSYWSSARRSVMPPA